MLRVGADPVVSGFFWLDLEILTGSSFGLDSPSLRMLKFYCSLNGKNLKHFSHCFLLF
jgi:hypothetical protein